MSDLKKHVEPKIVFLHAETFFSALRTLHGSAEPQLRQVIFPIAVLSAFTAELYFKALLLLDGKPLSRGHHLNDLFNKLSPETQNIVERKWNEIFALRDHALEGLDGQDARSMPTDLRSALREGNKTFELLRYLYEAKESFWFAIGDLPIVLRRAILELQPEWGKPDGFGFLSSDHPEEKAKRGFQPTGKITFVINHPKGTDWATDDRHHDVAHVLGKNLEVVVIKTKDRRLKFAVSGPLGKRFLFDRPVPVMNSSGVNVMITWTTEEAVLNLNGQIAEIIKLL
jgi:HEPN domain-containing protein